MTDFIFLGSKITADSDCSNEIKRQLLLGRKAMTNLDRAWKGRCMTLPTKIHIVKGMVFPVVMCGCESYHKEGWALKHWCFWTIVLEKTLESPLNCKEFKPVNPKGIQPWIFTGRTNFSFRAEVPTLLLADVKSQLIGKDPDAGKDWGQEDEMVGWHHWLDGHGFEQILGDSEEQGSLVSCSSWGCQESDMT